MPSFLNGLIPAYFSVYFRLFIMPQFKFKLIKVYMVCFGFEPRAAGWKAQTSIELWQYPKSCHIA